MWLGERQLLSPAAPYPRTAFPLRIFCALHVFDRPHCFERTTVNSTCAPCPTPAGWLKTCCTAPVWGCLCNSCPSDRPHTLGWRVEVDNIWHDKKGCNQRAFTVLRSLDSEIGEDSVSHIHGMCAHFYAQSNTGLILVRTVIPDSSSFTGED